MAKSNKDRNSFRRNPIDEVTERKKQEGFTAEQTSHLAGIHNKLDDVQAATELGAEATENSSNKIANSLGHFTNSTQKTLGDILASTELTTESVNNGWRELGRTSNIISNKLTAIFKELQSANKGLSKLASLEDTLKGKTPTDNLPEPVPPAPEPFPEENHNNGKGENNDNPPPPANNKPRPSGNNDDESPKKKPKKPKSDSNEKVKKKKPDDPTKGILIDGFKALTAQGDTVSKLLFDITVTSAANAAKTVLMIGALILGIDIIRMNFQYYSKMLETNFKGFQDKFGKISPILEDILTSSNDVIDAMKDGLDGEKLSNAVVKGLKSLFVDLVSTISLSLSNAVAGMLRALHFVPAADYVEGKGLSQYQDMTGAHLKGRDKDLAGKYDLQWEKDLSTRREENTATPDELKKNKYYDPSIPSPDYMKFGDEKAATVVSDKNNVLSDIQTATDRLNSSEDPSKLVSSMQSFISQVNSEYNTLKTESNDAGRMVKPQLDALNKLFEDKKKTASGSVSPGNPKDNPDNVKERAIDTQSRAQRVSPNTPGGSSNVSVNNSKNITNQTIQKMTPVTSVTPPGIASHNRHTN